MPILEKITQSLQARHWTDSIPLEFHYTAGVAGEEFRRVLKDSGRFLLSKCAKCKTTYIPARMFCPSCFVEMKETMTLDEPGYVYSYTTVNRNRTGEESEAVEIALIRFDGVKGGIVHKLDVSDPSKLAFGMKVVPILKDAGERTGALTDIKAFRPQ
ncbi:hypothetical protein AUI06_06675 [archaeon 13_2_20CM_2_52_21]|nr:MAG: hypothetical protein AUI06_06675 [archaeon 13_2_20CM_2_52_21]OLD44202.1 MAG: hypothetical protein AUI51_03245 [archaeon 13_1_40CM_2_52_4]